MGTLWCLVAMTPLFILDAVVLTDPLVELPWQLATGRFSLGHSHLTGTVAPQAGWSLTASLFYSDALQ